MKFILEGSEEKRYVAKIEIETYVFAKNDSEAKKIAEKMSKKMKDIGEDNSSSKITELVELQFGSLSPRKVL